MFSSIAGVCGLSRHRSVLMRQISIFKIWSTRKWPLLKADLKEESWWVVRSDGWIEKRRLCNCNGSYLHHLPCVHRNQYSPCWPRISFWYYATSQQHRVMSWPQADTMSHRWMHDERDNDQSRIGICSLHPDQYRCTWWGESGNGHQIWANYWRCIIDGVQEHHSTKKKGRWWVALHLIKQLSSLQY